MTSVGLAGGVAPVSVGVPVDAPASGEAVEGRVQARCVDGRLGRHLSAVLAIVRGRRVVASGSR